MNSNLQKTQFEKAADKLVINAPAKINLYLMIAGRRADRYHNIDTLMSKITWYDQVIIERSDTPGVALKCEGQYWAPENDDNLIIKAAKALEKATGFKPSVKITLIKNIPAGTGLGSASSDAAATLIGLNEYFSLGLDGGQLAAIAAQFGSDTAFFTGSPMAVCTGRGEILESAGAGFNFRAMIIVPDISVPTVDVYRKYSHNPQVYDVAAAAIKPLMEKGRIGEAAALGINMLAESCFDLNPRMRTIYEQLNRIIPGGVTLSGSGSAFYALLDSQTNETIEQCAELIKKSLGFNTVFVSNNRW